MHDYCSDWGPSIVKYFIGTLVILQCVQTVGASPGDDKSAATAATRQAVAERDPDFLFGSPKGWIGIRGGRFFSREDSQIFDFTRDLLTVDQGEFDLPIVGFDLGLTLNPQTDALFAIDLGKTSIGSEFREFVDEYDLGVTQVSSLADIELSGSLKRYLTSRGRKVSQYAWIPSTLIPYVGAGGGLLWYKFSQSGDFVDFIDLSIFTDDLQSSGWTFGAHVFGGVDIKLSRKVFLTTQVRYRWAATQLKRDFVGFDSIDLDGVKITAGVLLLF